ncbi:MAG TPA: transaldolase, partial [Polyangia bacterium]|nr:transaldolase [Polyangia bacterium]
MTNLHRTLELGQSIWYDNIRKGIIASGELQALIAKGVVGITSNPTIFEKAISGSADYDQELGVLAARGLSAEDIYEKLAVDDIRAACDLLLPVYTSSAGVDGRVSLEVLPALASNTADTISEGKRLAALVGRPNVMIKVPATAEGLPAVRALTAAGISVNVTLIFSLAQYKDVLEAYIAGVEERVAAGGSLEGLASVASFFVSRVDSVCDKLLDEKRASGTPEEGARAEALRGKIAIANAKLAFEIFTEVTGSARWKALAPKGARPQRLLWASTGTKDKRYPDTLYLDGLIGPDTVNTVPPETLNAFIDHGKPALTLGQGLAEARAQVADLAKLGIDLDKVCRGLLADGVKAFLVSMNQLIGVVSARRAALLERASGRQRLALSAEDGAAVAAALSTLTQQKAVDKLWASDPTVFTTNRAHDKSIQSRLGWLRSPEGMLAKVPEIATFARELRLAGRFKRVVLLGMGGSSLCPEVFAMSFRGQVDGLELDVLDNTDPAAVLAVEARGDLKTTLFIVASKSGGTLEIRAFEAYFWEQVSRLYRKGDKDADKDDDARTGEHFVAITDPGTAL